MIPNGKTREMPWWLATYTLAEWWSYQIDKKMKPNIIWDYNEGMSGIDWADQMVSYYDCLRKTTRWYKKIALHIFDIFLFSVLCLNSKYDVDKLFNLLKLRETIITDLIGDSLKEIPWNKTSNLSDGHYLTAIPPNEKKRLLTRLCKFGPK